MEFSKTMLVLFHIYLFLLSFCRTEDIIVTTEDDSNAIENKPSVTQTVYGFLDFTTTIGNTVMVFSPQSAATTSAKPTEPITIIKEKPQTQTTVVEILPSKAVTESLPMIISPETSDTSSFISTASGPSSSSSTATTAAGSEKDSSSPTTKTTSKITTISQNSTVAKVKFGRATPKSLGGSNSTQPKPVSKDKLKTLPPKAQTVTESAVTSQITSTTKKSVDKKTTAKNETATKPTPKIKIEKLNKPHIIVPANSSSKGKLITKTEKPKTTTSPKTTTKFTSPVFIPQSSPTTQEDTPRNSVVVASKVEVREGATSVQKVKKSDVEPTTAQTPSSVSIVEAKPITEQLEQHTTASDPSHAETEGKNVTEEPAVISSSGVSAPEYDFLSRQPSEVIDETFRIIDLKPSSGKYSKSKTSPSNAYRGTTPAEAYEETQPLGLITSLSDSVIKDGLTTIYETNVIGTVVSGKYAQVLQSNSHVQSNAKKIKPSSTIRILKTAAPTHKGNSNYRAPNLEATPTYTEDSSSVQLEVLYNGDQGVRPSRKPTLNGNNYNKNKYSSNKNKYKDDYKDEYGTTAAEEEEILDTDFTAPGNSPSSPAFQASTPSTKKATTKKSNTNGRPLKSSNNRFQRPTTPELATVSVFSETQASVTPSYGSNSRRFLPSNRRTTSKPVTSTETEKSYTNAKRSYKTKPAAPSSGETNNINSPVTQSSFKFKLNRPGGRWQYKTSPKPRVTIRRQDESLENITVSPIPQFTPDIQLEGSDQELSGSGIYPALQHEDNSIVHDVTPTLTAETLRVEISTPADFKDVYYEIATIKSPYSFQVGTIKNTRFITVTSTFEKSLVQATEAPTISKTEPLSENILVSTHNAYDKEPPLDSSVATLPPIGLAGDAETPPLETTTESFSTTQLMLKTHILPVVRGGSDTTSYTLVQSYHVTRLVTAVKTLPPMEVYQFVPSKTLNEFNTRLDEAGSEVHLELDFGDNNEHDDEPRPNVAKALLSDLDLTNIGSNFDIADVDRNKILEQHLRAKKAHHKTSTTPLPSSTPEVPTTPALRPEQLQQLALLRLFNPNAALPNMITSSRPVYKVETAYETFLLPISVGGSTIFSTISKPTATVTKTEYEYVTNTLPTLQSSIFNPLFPQQPSFQIATTPVVTQTMVTETNSKVLKLTFGAKTSYTTLFSTKVTPTILTTYLTNSIPLQPTVSPFPGFFNPSPYGYNAPFPFVG